jgi:hypothetical protein
MRKILTFLFFIATLTSQAQFSTTITGQDTACISFETDYSVEVSMYQNKYLFRDTAQTTTLHAALDAGYDYDDITNTFSYDLWVKPTSTITMVGESNVCSGGVSVPLANSGQNWAIVPRALSSPNMSVGLTIGTNGLMIGEHSTNILVSRLSYTATINDWVHVGIVYDTDSIFLYLNGNVVRKREIHCSTDPKCIASNLAGFYYSPEFLGDIDEFRVWDIALTKEQINEVKDKKLLNQVDGLRYYASFNNGKFERTLGDIGTLSMIVDDAITPEKNIKSNDWDMISYNGSNIDNLTQFLVGDLNYLWSTGETTKDIAYTPLDTLNKLFLTIYNPSVSKTDSILIIGQNCCVNYVSDTIIVYDTISNNIVLNNGLVGYYPFNGNADDKSINNNNGIIEGAQLTTDRNDVENSAYLFDGIDDYIKVAGGLPITNEFTLSFWAYSENTTGYSNIICDGSSSYGGNDFLINFRGNDLGIRADKDASLNYEDYSPSELQNLNLVNNWVHVTWVMSPTYSKIFINGEEQITINETGSNEGYHDDYSFIGARQVWGSPDNFFKGKLDNICMYDRILNDNEINALYTETNYFETVYDTTFVTVYDTVLVSVTDTLIIDAVLTGIDPPNNTSQLKVYPNPAKEYLIVNTGEYDRMTNYSIKIINQTGQVVYETNVSEPTYEINLSSWTGNGLYFLQLFDDFGDLIDVKKIVIQ